MDASRHLKVSPIFGHGVVDMVLVVHLLLGYRRLRDLRYYQDDPLVRRVLGLTRLPDIATLSRTLAGMDHHSADQMPAMIRRMVGNRLVRSGLKRTTVDFDGLVLPIGRFAKYTAVGFNRKKKSQRSYYPLFCTIAQTVQVFDLWHRSGNAEGMTVTNTATVTLPSGLTDINPTDNSASDSDPVGLFADGFEDP